MTVRRIYRPGVPTTDHHLVGERFVVVGGDQVGEAVSVTPWGGSRVRWIRLRFGDGSEKSYAPSHLRIARS